MLPPSSSLPQARARSNSSLVRGSSQRSSSSLHQSDVERGEGEVLELLLLLLLAAAAATQRSLLHGEEGEEGGKGSFGTGDDERGRSRAGAAALALIEEPPRSAERDRSLLLAPLGAAGLAIIALLLLLLLLLQVC